MGREQTDVSRSIELGIRNAFRSIVGTLFWTVTAVFAILVGYSAILIGIEVSTDLATITFVAIGLFVIGCSVYLLYDMYRPVRA